MYYAEELIEEIRMQNDIVDVISEYVHLKKKGTSYFGLCPFHNEKSASFSVSPDRQIYHCFGCGAGGNVISFIMQIENYDFVDAIKYLAQKANINLPEAEYSDEAKKQVELKKILFEINKEAARYFYSNLHIERGQVALRYLNERHILTKFQRKFGLGFSNYARGDLYQYLLNKGYKKDILLKSGLVSAEKNKDTCYDRFNNRLMFPIFDIHNNVIGFGGRIIGSGEPKYLNSPETILFDKSKNLYGLNLARLSKKNQIIIVEGYMDTITLHQAGFNNTVASLGTSFNIEHSKLLRKYTQEVILIFDSDEAGINATLRAIPILLSSGLKVKVLQIPNAKDPDEYLQKYGQLAFENLLATAKSYIDFQILCIKKKYNIENTEEKIKFTTEVAKLLQKLDNDIEKDAYIKQTAKITDISEGSIRSEISKINLKIETPKKITNQKPILTYNNHNTIKQDTNTLPKNLIKAQISLLNLIATNELVYEKVKQYLKPENFIEASFQNLAKKIYELRNKKSNIYPAELINYFDKPEEQKIVSAVFSLNTEEYSQISTLEKLINDQVKLILKTHLNKISKELKDENVYEMQQLLEDGRNLDKLNITLTDG